MAKLGTRIWLAMWAIYIIWGSTYLAIAYAIETMPPLVMAGVRFIIAGAVMYPIGLRRAARAGERPRAHHWRAAAIVGIALCLGGNGLVTIAEHRVSSGVAALIVATIPLWIALFEWGRYRVRLGRGGLAGLVIGFGAVAMLVAPWAGDTAVDPTGGVLLVGAALFWSMGSLYARRAPLPDAPLLGTAMEMLAGGAALMLVGTIGGEWSRLDLGTVSAASLGGLAYLIVFGSLIGFSSYVWLLRNAPTGIVATYAYVNPLVAVLLGWLFRGERLTGIALAAGALIVGSVASIVMTGGTRATAVEGAEPPDEPGIEPERLPA